MYIKSLLNAKEALQYETKISRDIQKIKSKMADENPTNIYKNIKDEWIKKSKENAVIVRLNERNITRSNHILFRGDIFHSTL